LIPSPSGLGSVLATGPPGLASIAILQCHFFLATGKPAAQDDKKGASSTQAKTGLEWGTQPSLPVKELDAPHQG
jgi:hypothetical protein